jgi:hypothetical protein
MGVARPKAPVQKRPNQSPQTRQLCTECFGGGTETGCLSQKAYDQGPEIFTNNFQCVEGGCGKLHGVASKIPALEVDTPGVHAGTL